MCAIPAGMDISERIAGIIRPKNMTDLPCRSNHFWALLTSLAVIKNTYHSDLSNVSNAPCLALYRYNIKVGHQ